MDKMKKFWPYPIIVCIVAIIVIWCCSFYPIKTVLMVRHAEKASSPPSNPPLTAAGNARAQTLVHVVGNAGITSIYASQFQRTQQTVQPLADHLGHPITQVNADNIDELVNLINSAPADEVIFIASHSNRIPQLIERLNGDSIPVITEDEFDNLFVVTIYSSRRSKVINLKYGNPT